MKRNILRTVLVSSALALVMALSSVAFANPDETESSRKLKEISGTVTFKRPGGFFLKTASGDEYKLVLGPIWHLDNIGLELKNGEKISAEGYEDAYSIFFVTSIKKGAETYVIAGADAYDLSDYGPYAGMHRGWHGHGEWYDEYGPYAGMRRGGYGHGGWHHDRYPGRGRRPGGYRCW